MAWCLHGDTSLLPEPVRGPMLQLADAWRRKLGDLLDGTTEGSRAC